MYKMNPLDKNGTHMPHTPSQPKKNQELKCQNTIQKIQ